jgi:nitroimidazol reductase NimA-like FMN-containing flavoprotein (pyridoxamine 5'-phosphate oxidase superfamily)
MAMHIQIMSEADCMTFIRSERTGRLACSHDNRPYVVPIHYVCFGSSIVSFSMPGQKLDFMRSNPNVCFEVDSIGSGDTWTCVVIEGVFHEFTSSGDKQNAWDILKQHNDWWEVGSQHVGDEHQDGHREPTFFSVSMDLVTGRQATSSKQRRA